MHQVGESSKHSNITMTPTQLVIALLFMVQVGLTAGILITFVNSNHATQEALFQNIYPVLQHVHADMTALRATTVKLHQVAYTDLIASLASFNSTLFAPEEFILQKLTPSALAVISPPNF